MRAKAILLPILCLCLAALACSRADVTTQGGIGSGSDIGIGETQAPQTPTGEASSLLDEFATEEPIATATPTPNAPEPLTMPTFPPTPTLPEGEFPDTILYESQPGDTPLAVAVRFGVLPEELISAGGSLPEEGSLIDPGTLLVIPRRLGLTGPDEKLIPDSEMVFSPHASDFDVEAFVASQGGFLNQYGEYVSGHWRSGAQALAIAARDNTTNPRLLLALLEYYTHWVTDPAPAYGDALRYPLGYRESKASGLYHQLTWLANELGTGYYEWRAGKLTELEFADGSRVRLAPGLNAGTVALQYHFSQHVSGAAWEEALGPQGFMATYEAFFGDAWAKEHPLFEPGVRQPEMILPFLEGRRWSFTGGPHGAWVREAAWAAIDFAPVLTTGGCAVSRDWAVAAAAGLVVRSEDGVVALDLDGDGREQTGWVLIYLHVATQDRVEVGTFVEQGDLIGHPSCEGGPATGSHIHLVRKYNGEWILADGPLPFELSGWVVHAGAKAYQGALVKGDQVVLACPCATAETLIQR
jgi:LasA protease